MCGSPVPPAHGGQWAEHGGAQVPHVGKQDRQGGQLCLESSLFVSHLSSISIFGDNSGRFALVLSGGFSATSHVGNGRRKGTSAGER